MEQEFALEVSSADKFVQCQKCEAIYKTLLFLTCRLGKETLGAFWKSHIISHTYQMEINKAIVTTYNL